MTRTTSAKTLAIAGTLLAAIAATSLAQATPGDLWHYTTGSHGACLNSWNIIDTSGCTYGVGADAFGGGPNLCGHAAPTTNWPVDSDLYVWRYFVVPQGSTQAAFSWVADNDMDVYVDGVLKVRDRNSNCDTGGTSLVAISPGAHKIAAHVADYGDQSYFDLDVSFR